MIGADALLLPNTLIVLFVFTLLTMAAINLTSLRRLNDYKKLSIFPRISVLVPARNEQDNIRRCIESLLGQDYPQFQVIVLDDNSQDSTGSILAEMAGNDSRLKIIQGKPLPPDWLGKHWACHQLYQQSDGDFLVYTDADTFHKPDTLRCAAAALIDEQADMLSIMPRHILGSWSEKLVMPVFALGVFAIIPLLGRLKPRKVTLMSSSGKLLAFRRQAYEASGGFEAIRHSVLDDLELPQRIISAGMRYRLFDGTNNVSCRMYRSLKEVHEGLSKNLFAAYGYNVPLFILTWLWLMFALWEPLIVLAIYKIPEYPPTLSLGLSVIAIIGTLLLWLVYYQRFKFPLYMIFLYPISGLMLAALSASSMILTLSGRATWKDRKMPTHKIY